MTRGIWSPNTAFYPAKWRPNLCSKPFWGLSLSSVSMATIELKSANSCAPVEAAGRGVVLIGIPERTVIYRINRHAAVVSPAFERTELRTTAVE